MPQIGISLAKDMIEELDREAKSIGRSRSYVAAQRIERGLEARPSEVADLVMALRGLVAANDRPCHLDRNGMCDAHFRNSPCEVRVARIALTPFAEVTG